MFQRHANHIFVFPTELANKHCSRESIDPSFKRLQQQHFSSGLSEGVGSLDKEPNRSFSDFYAVAIAHCVTAVICLCLRSIVRHFYECFGIPGRHTRGFEGL